MRRAPLLYEFIEALKNRGRLELGQLQEKPNDLQNRNKMILSKVRSPAEIKQSHKSDR